MSAATRGSQDRPWTAERELDGPTALAPIREAFPSLHAGQLESLGTAWDNTAFLLDGAWVFRFPRSEIAVDLLRAESQVLPIIAPQLPLSVPVPEYLGQPTERFPRPFAGYRMLPGRTACRVRLDEVARAGLIPDARPWLELLTQLPDSCQPGNGG